MPVKKGTAVVTILCRNSSLICCCSGCFSACAARDARVAAAVAPPKLPTRQGSGVPAPGTWAAQLLLLQPSLPHCLPFPMPSTGTGRYWLGMACVGHRDGKVEQEEGKGVKKRSTLSQNQVSVSILSALQSLGNTSIQEVFVWMLRKKWILCKKPHCLCTLFLWIELTLPVECQLKRYLNIGIWANLLFLNKFLSIVFKFVGNKIQIFHCPGKQAEGSYCRGGCKNFLESSELEKNS